jgi:hypothetical protein
MIHLPKIKIILEGGQLRVRSPYHPQFPPEARKLNGKWDGQEWVFDPRLEEKVRALLTQIYGWDGTYPVLIADVRVILDRLPEDWWENRSLWLLGRELAFRPGWNARVKLGPGVVVADGGFPPSGGFRKHPSLAWEKGTVLWVMDVPVAKIEAVREKYPEAIEEIPGTRRNVMGPDEFVPASNSGGPAWEDVEAVRRILLPGEGEGGGKGDGG